MRSASSSIIRCLVRTRASRAQTALSERIPAPKRLYHPPRASALVRPSPILRRAQPIPSPARFESTSSNTPPQNGTSTTSPESRLDRDEVPAYELTFTCTVCNTRSSHRVSKQGYHHGTTLIACPGCKNRHLISDHLKIFSDKSTTLEDIMRDKGDLVKRGTLSADGDVEFWDDGSSTPRSSHFHANSTTTSDSDTPQSPLTEPPASEKAK